jgi:hypothetical protein
VTNVRSRPLLVSLCALLAFADLHAQDNASPSPTPSPSPAATAAPAATPIPLADVVAAADAVSERLQSTEAEVSANETTAIVSRELPLLTDEIGGRLSEMTTALKPGAPRETLWEFEGRWQKISDQLAWMVARTNHTRGVARSRDHAAAGAPGDLAIHARRGGARRPRRRS